MKALRLSDFNSAFEKILQILPQCSQVQHAAALIKFNQEVQIAARPFITSGHGAEYADIPSTVLRGDAKNICPLGFQDLTPAHVVSLPHCRINMRLRGL